MKCNPEFTGTLDYEDFEVNVPDTLGKWTVYFFYAKNFFLVLSYLLLMIYMLMEVKII